MRVDNPRPIIDGMKFCPDCGDYKPLDDFARSKWKAQGRNTYCKAHHAARYSKRSEPSHD